MKVEHITALTHDSVVRDMADILLPTRHHFAGALPQGKNPVLIPGTTLSILLTVDWPTAIFTLFKGETPLLTNICSFAPASRETAMQLAHGMMQQSPFFAGMKALKSPKLDTFIITVPVLPLATPQEMMLAGEIELYIYYAIYEQYQP